MLSRVDLSPDQSADNLGKLVVSSGRLDKITPSTTPPRPTRRSQNPVKSSVYANAMSGPKARAYLYSKETIYKI